MTLLAELYNIEVKEKKPRKHKYLTSQVSIQHYSPFCEKWKSSLESILKV